MTSKQVIATTPVTTKPTETPLTLTTLEQLLEAIDERFFTPLNERLDVIENRLNDLSADYGDGYGIED